ncbi:MAG TPA: Calx-beta domain-containing protein, partial [Polyangiaceae bacterium]|nr:Calx-beta domain-containing protein [Polyangiaceae bacterium]
MTAQQVMSIHSRINNHRRPALAAITMCAGLFISPVAEAWQLQAGQASLPATGSGATFVAVSFGQTYPAPPVVVTLIGRDDTAPAAVRIRNVTPSGFELVQVEPGGANGDHGAEVVHWLAVEQGQHVLADGTMIEAGTINTMAVQHGTGVTGTESWQSLSYGSSFAAPPVLLTELQSMNNEVATLPENPSEPWLVVGVRNVTTLGAQVALERCESAPGSVSVPETIGYVAVEAGRTGTITADDATEVAYETLSTPDSIVGPGCVQMTFASTFPAPPLVIGHLTRHDVGDGGWLRRCARTATDVTLVVDEDQYRDSERNHGTEAAGLLLFERAFVAEIGGGGPGLPVVALASVTASVDENGGSVNITIVLSATSDSDVTVDCATADLTANGGSDFVPLNEPVTIPSGQISGVVTVSIADDLVAEGTEDFLVSITNPIGATLGTPESTTVTIVDNEPVPTVAFFTAAQPVDENAGSIGLTVVVSGPSSHDISVDYTTLDGTALSGSDYVALSDTLVIAAGQTSGLIPVTITDDAVAEGT